MASDSVLGGAWGKILSRVFNQELEQVCKDVLEKKISKKKLDKIRERGLDIYKELLPDDKEIFDTAATDGYQTLDMSSLCKLVLKIFPKIPLDLESIRNDIKEICLMCEELSELSSISKDDFDRYWARIENVCQIFERVTEKKYLAIVSDIKRSVLDKQKEKDISSKKDDILQRFETWFHQKHGSINIRHLYLGKVCTSRGNLEKGEIVIVSVIESKDTIENETYHYDGENLTVVYKCWGEISASEEKKKDQTHDYGEVKEIAKHLKKKENEMFEKHSNLEMARASLFRMKTNKEKKEETISEPCIVLYCSYKGVVPVGEKEFPAEMGGFPTDIREGFFHLHVNYDIYANSKDLLDPLRMGANISLFNDEIGQGTLGGFVELNNGGVGFITCAHVLHSADEMQGIPFDLASPVMQPSVFQEGSQQCGYILKSAFPSSTIVDGVSVDAAVVEITERVPDRALFADLMTARLKSLGFSRSRFPRVCCGKIRSRHETQNHLTEKTLKCGMTSGLTLGEVEQCDISVRFRNILRNDRRRISTIYKSQLAIRCIGNDPFSECGDSGALVFQCSDVNDLFCIGMIVGGGGGFSIATPITSVLEALSVTLEGF